MNTLQIINDLTALHSRLVDRTLELLKLRDDTYVGLSGLSHVNNIKRLEQNGAIGYASELIGDKYDNIEQLPVEALADIVHELQSKLGITSREEQVARNIAARLSLKYHVGDVRKLTKPQLDDDDAGNERRTPAGETVEIIAIIPENKDNPYHVGCPATGGSWFFSEAELEAETEVVQ